MTTTGYSAIRKKQDALIRKPLDGGVHLAPSSATALALTTLFSATTGVLEALPTGYNDLGYLDKKGASFTRKVTNTSIASWQSVNPTRIDVTDDEGSVQFACQESNVHTVALFYGADESAIKTTPNKGGAIAITKPTTPVLRTYRLAVFGVDGEPGTSSEIDIVRFYPRAILSNYTKQALANGATPILYGVEFTATVTDTLGTSEMVFFGGPGWLSLLTEMGFTAPSTLSGPPEGDEAPGRRGRRGA